MAREAIPYTLTPKQIATFGNLTGDPHPLHRDSDLAREAGLAGTPVMGAYLLAHVMSQRSRAETSTPTTNLCANFSGPIYAGETWHVEREGTSYKGSNGHPCFDFTLTHNPPKDYKEPQRIVAGPIKAEIVITPDTFLQYNALMRSGNECHQESFAAALFPGAFIRTLMQVEGPRVIAYNHSSNITFRAALQPKPASLDIWLTRVKDRVHRLEGRLVQDEAICATAVLMAGLPTPINVEKLKTIREIPPYIASSGF
jgi:hypothetical protein